MSLTWEEAKKSINNVTNFLDTINLLPYLEKFKGKTVRAMMNELERDYPYKDEYSTVIFDVISEDKFAKYLNKRYKLNIMGATYTYYYI